MEIRFELLPLPNYYTALAHPHATDAAVYTALFFFGFKELKLRRGKTSEQKPHKYFLFDL